MRIHNPQVEEVLKYIICHASVGGQVIRLQGRMYELAVGITWQVNIKVRLELAEEDIGPQVLRKREACIFTAHKSEEISVCEVASHHAAIIEGAVSPGIQPCQHGRRSAGRPALLSVLVSGRGEAA